MKKIILAGGSGFLGKALAAKLVERNDEVVVLTRSPETYDGAGRAAHWDGSTCGAWGRELDAADAVVNLTGKNVNCRPSQKNRDEILSSRVDSVEVLGQAIRAGGTPPKCWLQAGSLAIYGNPGDALCDETAPTVTGYPADVCAAWENAFHEALLPEMRGMILRIGFVLGMHGGALPFLAKLTKAGLGGSIGSGRQWISWIHINDALAILLTMIDEENFSGIYNITAPNPVRNREFMAEMRRVLRRPWSPPAPAFAARLAGPLLNSDPEIGLSGRRCISRRLENFQYPELRPALLSIYNKRG